MPEPSRLPKTIRTRVAVERATSSKCRCGHLAAYHQPDRRLCLGSPVCGCADYRAEDGKRWPPVRVRDEYDPSPYGVDRRTR